MRILPIHEELLDFLLHVFGGHRGGSGARDSAVQGGVVGNDGLVVLVHPDEVLLVMVRRLGDGRRRRENGRDGIDSGGHPADESRGAATAAVTLVASGCRGKTVRSVDSLEEGRSLTRMDSASSAKKFDDELKTKLSPESSKT